MHAIVAYHYFGGAGYPVGGASEIAAGIAPVIERTGGQILVSAEVSAIMVERGRAVGVRMADDRELRARTVISDVGAYNTFARLLPGGAGVPDDIKSIPPSMSHACLYVGLKREAGEADFEATNLWIYDGPDHDAAVERYTADPGAPLPAVFVSFPSAKDPTFPERYPERSTIEVVTPVPYGVFERWADTRWRRRGTEYEDFKADLAARLRAELERHVPATRGKIDYDELSTPLSTRHFSNYEQGEIYGYAAVPARFRARSLGARTSIRDLYLTGQDTASLGVMGALSGGVITASLVLGRNLMSKVTRPYAASGSATA
jgi:all-trans-retinol 13,14-reductase